MTDSQRLIRILMVLGILSTFHVDSITTRAQGAVLFSEDFEGLQLGPNIDEGVLNIGEDTIYEEAWSPDGPAGWTVDRSGVPGYGTPNDGVLEFAGWTFIDPILWAQTAEDQDRSFFTSGTGFVIAVADGDEWDDAPHPPGNMNTFLTSPPIPVAGMSSGTELEFFSSWRPDRLLDDDGNVIYSQTATITASYDGGAPVEIHRYESDPDSDYYQPDANPEDVFIPLDIPQGAQEVVLTFGYTNAGNAWWWAVDNIVLGGYEEDFEGVELGPNVEEGRSLPVIVDQAWTNNPPAGWAIDNSVPGQDEDLENNGITEWIGWSLADKDWWVGVAEDQRRSEFTKGQGTVLVADPDEWDDAAHPDSATEGWYNTFISTSEISLEGVDASSVELTFDSSWRPEFDDDYQQTGNITVSFDGGPEMEVLLWSSDENSPNYKNDNSTNETIIVPLNNPAGAQSMVVKFGLFDAGNDWWWAIDNIEISGTGNVGIPGDYNGNGSLDAGDLDLQAAIAIGRDPYDAKFDENKDGEVNSADREIWLNELKKTWVGDSNLDLEFNTADFVDVFTAGKYETGLDAGWAEGDWDGNLVFTTNDFVAAFIAGGYEKGPFSADGVAAVPEPASALLLLMGTLFCHFARRQR